MSITSLPTNSQSQHSKAQGWRAHVHFRKAIDALSQRLVWLHRVRSNLVLHLYILAWLARNLYAHIVLLSSKEGRSISLGPVWERTPIGHLVPSERTQARKDGIDRLLAKYRWATSVEGKLFLEGFDTGVEWHERFHRRDGSALLE
jgi:hypothetical protein